MVTVNGLTTSYPKIEVFGAWIQNGPVQDQKDGDVHCYVSGYQKAVVIGMNRSYKDRIEYSDMALVVSEQEGLKFQYADAEGKSHHAEVSPEAWKAAILEMLEKLKSSVKLVPVAPKEVIK